MKTDTDISEDISEDPIETAYQTWKKTKSPDDMHGLLSKMHPLMKSQVAKLTGSQNPALMTHAKILAANAVKSYDPTMGAKLTTHVSTQLQPLIRLSAKYDRTLNTSERVLHDWKSMKDVEKEFADKHGREPTTQELADVMGLHEGRIEHVRNTVRGAMQESQMPEGMVTGGGTDSNLSSAAEYVYRSLSPREQMIFELKTGYRGRETLAAKDIANKLGISESAVSSACATIGQQIIDAEKLL